VVLVAQKLEGGPVNSRVGVFPEVFRMVEGGSKGTQGVSKPLDGRRLTPGEFGDGQSMSVKYRR